MSRFKWSDENTEYLIKNYPNASNKELADAIGTTVTSVKNKVLNLQKHGIYLSKTDKYMNNMHQRRIKELHEWWNEDSEQKYETKRLKQRSTIVNKLNEIYQINYDQEQIILGTCMGNASLGKTYNRNVDPFPYITMTQGYKNGCYLDWKYEIFKQLCPSPIEYCQYNNSTFGNNGYYRFTTRHLPCFDKYYDILRPNDQKREVTEEWINMINFNDPLALAVFYMDVGSNTKFEKYYPQSGRTIRHSRIQFSLGDKTEKESQLICDWIAESVDISPRLYIRDARTRTGTNEVTIRIHRNRDTEVFIDFVEPIVSLIPCMKHLMKKYI